MSLDFYLIKNLDNGKKEYVFETNITHNLNRMADAAGIYGCLWRPDENDFHTAADVIPVLRAGLCKLVSDPSYYKKFDAENGWGLYVDFVPFCINVLEACMANLDAEIEVSR